MVGWGWALALLGIGTILVVLEFFVPSAGLLGIAAVLCLVTAVVVGYLDSILTGTTILGLEMLGIPILLTLMVRVWPHTPIGKRLFLAPPDEASVSPLKEQEEALRKLIGKSGVARSTMTPSGVVVIEGRTYDALADGEAVSAGEAVVVKTIRMNRVIVRRQDRPIAPGPDDRADVLSKSLEELGIEPFEMNDSSGTSESKTLGS